MVGRLRPAWLVVLTVLILIPHSSTAQWVNEGVIPVGGVHALEVFGDAMFAATDKGVFVSIDGGSIWKPSRSGQTDWVVRDIIVRGDDLIAGTHHSGAFVSHNNGESWAPMSSGLPEGPVGGRELTTVEIDGVFFIGTGAGVFVSTDGGVSWDSFSFGLPSFRLVEDLATIGSTLYASIFFDGVYSIEKGNDEWLAMNAGLPSSRSEPHVECLAAASDVLLAGTEKGVYRFDFDDHAWEKISSGSADTQIYDLMPHRDAFLAATTRGVFRSDDQGADWTESGSGLPLGVSVCSLLSVGSRLFAGTHGAGVYISNDGGRTWAMFNSEGPLPDDAWVESLAVLGHQIIASTGEGVFVSRSEGGGWTETRTVGPGLWEVSGVTSIGNRVFAGNFYGGIVPSSDYGTTWPCPDDRDFPPNEQVLSLGSVGGRLLASTLGEDVLTSSDDGETWSPGNSGLWTSEVNVFWTSGTDVYAGGYEGIFMSNDLGQSWAEVAEDVRGLSGTEVVSLEDVAGQLYALTDRGVFRFDGEDATWSPVDSPMERGTAWFGSFIDFEGGVLFAAVGGRLFISPDFGVNWAEVGPESGLDLRNLAAIESIAERIFAGTRDGVFVSTDGGSSWVSLSSGLPKPAQVKDFAVSGDSLVALTDEGLFLLHHDEDHWIEVSTNVKGQLFNSIQIGEDTLFVATWEGLSRSTDNGESWTSVGAGLGESPEIHAITAMGPNLFVATEFGDFRSPDHGETFDRVFAGAYPDGIGELEVIDSRLFAACADGVFRSSDGGESWIPFNVGLPVDIDVRSFAQHGTRLYAGTDKGVIVSEDGGATWSAVTADLPTAMTVRALATDGHYLYAGGLGGVFLSVDGGASWRPVNTGLPIGDFYLELNALVILGNNVFAGTGIGIYRSSVGGESWAEVPGTANVNTFHIAGDRVFAASSFGVDLSIDQGTTWNPVSCGFRPDTCGDLAVIGDQVLLGTDLEFFAFDTESREWRPFDSVRRTSVTVASLAEMDGDIFATTWERGIYLMRSGKDHWVPSNFGIPYPIVKMVFPLGDDLFADVNEHGIYRSKDRGRTWSKSGYGLPGCCWDTDLMGGETALFANFGDKIFASTDHGDSWKGLNSAWPDTSHVGLLVEVENCLIVGTTDGIFRSRDGGSSWEDLNTELPSGAQAQTLTVVGTDVVATLDGGAVWRLPSACD